jgi:hypothetical protein
VMREVDLKICADLPEGEVQLEEGVVACNRKRSAERDDRS